MYNSSLNKTSLLERAIHRSNSRLSNLKSFSKFSNNDPKDINAIDSTIGVSTYNEYLIEISIGTPPIKQLAIFDTGSDVVWTQCLPCINCFEQTQPIFNSERSRSYQELMCGAKECNDLGEHKTCRDDNSKCEYTLQYYDNSYSKGDLALETFKLGNTFFPHMVYGCSKNNIGHNEDMAGVVGFGYGPHSLISQLGDRAGGKFAYCLVHHSELDTRSKINFGASAIVSGRRTRLVSNYVTLEAISVQNVTFRHENIYTRIPFTSQAFLDTGTFISYFPSDLYKQLRDALRSMISAITLQSGSYRHCYSIYPNFPTIILYFSGGAELVLPMENTLVQYNDKWCLGINSNDENENEAVIGNMLQVNHMIGYDLENESVSFRETDCSNLE